MTHWLEWPPPKKKKNNLQIIIARDGVEKRGVL